MKQIIKLILKYPFNKLGKLGNKLQRMEFRAKNYIEFDLFKDGEKYKNE